MSDYNHEYWPKRIQQYLDQDWAQQPSPFARAVNKFIKPGSDILELGTGAAQDGSWFASQGHKVTATDASTNAFNDIKQRNTEKGISIDLKKLDLTEEFPFADNSFDLVYAQLVLHYFDDETTKKIIQEISRVLKVDGILACMMNSTKDPEYVGSKAGKDGLIDIDGLIKRYFSVKSFQPFVTKFQPLLFDDQGKTPKDDAVGNSGMIRFIGRKHI